MQLNNLTN